MAKYKRFDPRNKKDDRIKKSGRDRFSRNDTQEKKIKKYKQYNEEI